MLTNIKCDCIINIQFKKVFINLSQYSYTTLENDCQGEEVKIMQNLEEIEIKLYSTDDVCKLLHIGKQKCLQLFHQEDFPSIKIGRKF